MFTSDKVKNPNGTTQDVNVESQPDIIRHNAEVFTEKCLKKHEFLQYDRLTLACGIIISARKVANLCDLWPEELVMMTGNRLRFPQGKKCMRHILSFFDEIDVSASSCQSSPVKSSPSTVQKTVKRAQIAMISNRKRERRNDKSCDQTTSKKVTCASVVAKKASNGSGSAQ